MSASDHLLKLLRRSRSTSELVVQSSNDRFLAPVIVKIIFILSKKPFPSWEESDFFLLTNFMIVACDGAMVDVETNVSAKRWLNVFSECSASLPSDLLPFGLWLFTISNPHDTIIKHALERLDSTVLMVGIGWWEQASGRRNRSLCRLKRHLFGFNVQCGSDFDKKLKATKEYGHLCFGCVAWSFRFMVTGLPKIQMWKALGDRLLYGGDYLFASRYTAGCILEMASSRWRMMRRRLCKLLPEPFSRYLIKPVLHFL